MKKLLLFLFATLIMGAINISAQNQKCGTMDYWELLKTKDPNTELRKQKLEIETQKWISENSVRTSKTILTIPVVVHVLYHTNEENISDVQIQSQIDVLNADFRLQNTDSLDDDHPFWWYTADTEIEFCLAKQDPDGNSTTGITRTYTDSVSFASGSVKYADAGGHDNWNPSKYLNFWICNINADLELLGFATFPSDLATSPEEDGVVISHQAFGTVGTSGNDGFISNTLGRTATHEVGHWLNLFHIWGDDACGDDLVEDTPSQEEENYGCPTFPHRPNNNCGTDGDGEMYMNYMDYVDDECMNMFTFGQSNRMWAAINSARSGLLTSNGCAEATGTKNIFDQKIISAIIYPNPNNGQLKIDIENNVSADIHIQISNLLGQVILQIDEKNILSKNYSINLDDENNGLYLVEIRTINETVKKKVILNK